MASLIRSNRWAATSASSGSASRLLASRMGYDLNFGESRMDAGARYAGQLARKNQRTGSKALGSGRKADRPRTGSLAESGRRALARGAKHNENARRPLEPDG
jgi:hypothetical protein